MPIYGLTPMLMEIGKIKIGMKGEEIVSKNNKTFRKAVRIDHFRIVTNERDSEDNLTIDEQLVEIIKKDGKAKFNKDGNLISIPIQLLYNDINLTFPHELVSMVNWKRSCSGNGKTAITRDGRTVKCPCPRIEPGYEGKDKCLYSGVLSCVIDGANIGGCHKFRTKGFNSVNYILSSLSLIKTITGGLLAFLPLNLIVTSKRTVNPKTGEPLTINVVTIETRNGGQEKLQKFALDLGHERTKLIENMGTIEKEAKDFIVPETEDEEKEIFEEFYPNNIIEGETKKETMTTDEKAEEKKPEKKDDAKMTGSETVKPTVKTKSAKKEDPLLGQATKPENINKSDVKPTESTVPETTVKPNADSEEKKPAKQETSIVPEKIRKDQLIKILDLKVNKRQINDQKVWHKLIKNMKFPDVTKANDMTVEQGDKFIKFLEELDDIPF